jgi:hypothetical protein
MSRIRFTKTATPNTPPINKSDVYVDTTDRKFRKIDDNGVLSILENDGLQDLNNLTNGGLMIQQRVATAATNIASVSLTTRAGQVADRWAVTVGNVTTPQWTQVDTGNNALEANLVARFYGKITQLTNAAKFIFSQFLASEDIAHLRGKKVRLSIKIKQFAGANANYRLGLLQLTSAGTIDVSPAFISAIGGASVEPTWGTNLVAISPDASPVGENGTISGVALTIASTAAWVRSSCVFTVPTTCLNLCYVLYRDTIGAASDVLGVAEMQMTEGSDLVEWVTLPRELEEFRCKRYFCKTFAPTVVPVQTGGVSNALRFPCAIAGAVTTSSAFSWQFPVTMWKTPVTITFFNPSAGNAFVRNVARSTDATATSSANASPISCDVNCTGLAAWTAGDELKVCATADSEFVA